MTGRTSSTMGWTMPRPWGGPPIDGGGPRAPTASGPTGVASGRNAGTLAPMATSKEYPGQGIVVTWEPARCIHVAACVRGLPQVFDPERRPWIVTDGVSGAEIAEVVRRCPSGALGYRSTDP